MLDERLINTRFTLPKASSGEIVLYGIHYHYRVADATPAGHTVVVVAVGALGLTVRGADKQLVY
ncbi:hypothetical protein [Lacticaseibacillus sp. GG6-2]